MTPASASNAFARLLAHESAGGVVLALAALAALIVSNSPLAPWYEGFLHTRGSIVLGQLLVLEKTLLVWVNDLLMAVFFFLVGLEIKREFVEGELASRRQAILPAGAALGGMAVPAAIYAAVNWGDATALRGWAIPSATDIAFAVGILMLLGSRVPASLKVFLTAVAIIDDLGAIVVIAIFYTDNLSALALGGAVAGAALLALLNRMGVTRIGPYVMVGLLVWVFVLKSGVHATLAGVITALAVPARDAAGASPLGKAENALHPWVAFAILPLFAFANAGVDLAGTGWATFAQPVTLGIVGGLLLGKVIGVYGSSWLLIRSGLAVAPAGASTLQFVGVALLCGIGFTMSLFIGGLAFDGLDAAYEARLKLGVLGGSLLSAAAGVAVLWCAGRRARNGQRGLLVRGCGRLRHQTVGIGDRHRREQEGDVDRGLRYQHLVGVVRGVDEGLQQVDRADADDGRGQLHFQHRRIDVAQPLGLVRVAFQVHARDEGLVAADDDHDQQVADHHHVDQRQHHQHDDGLVEVYRLAGVADALDEDGQRRLAAERRLDQVPELEQEVPDVDALGRDQAQVKRQLQPAAHEDQARQWAHAGGVGVGGALVHRFQGFHGWRHCREPLRISPGLVQSKASVSAPG